MERAPLAQPKTLIAAEVEQLVLENRSSDVAPKLVLRKGRARDTISVVEEVIGVQHLVAYEFVDRTMDLVRSRLGRKVDDSAGKPAVLRPQVVGLHLEFLDGVLGRNNGNYIQVRSIRRYTINQNLALTGLASANLKISKRERIGADRVAGRRVPGRRLALRHNAGHHCRQGNRVAAVEGQIGDGSLVDDLPQRVRLRLE